LVLGPKSNLSPTGSEMEFGRIRFEWNGIWLGGPAIHFPHFPVNPTKLEAAGTDAALDEQLFTCVTVYLLYSPAIDDSATAERPTI